MAATGSRVRTEADSDSTLRVRLRRLDDSLPERPFAMGRLDVEGTGRLALRGAGRLMARGEPAVWMLEPVDPFLGRFGSSVRDVRRWLGDQGHDMVLYDPRPRPARPRADPLRPGPDVLAVCRQRLPEVAARLVGAV